MRTRSAGSVAMAVAALVFLQPGCDPDSPPSCACTENFASVAFLVVAPSGVPPPPVPVTVVVVTQTRTDMTLPVLQDGLHAGVVRVVDDSFIPRLRPAGDTLQVAVTTALGSFAVDFTIGTDEPCHCHVQRLAGPEVVQLR